MDVIVLGAGVIGVTTAFKLAQRGCNVTVIERRQELAAEASFANGGQLSYDFASPMGSPQVLRHLVDYLTGRDEAFKIRLSVSAAQLGWGTQFLLNCLSARTRRNAERLSQLAHDAHDSMVRLTNEIGVQFAHRKAGKLVLYSIAEEFKTAVEAVSQNSSDLRKLEPLTAQECVNIEPALAGWGGSPVVGGLYAENDEVGDARVFANKIAAVAHQRFGVRFLLETAAQSIRVRNGNAVAVCTEDGEMNADAIVVCLGAGAPKLLQSVGLPAPVHPIFGYSISAPATTDTPDVAITDLARKMVYTRIGANTRIAGFADFGNLNAPEKEKRIDTLIMRAREGLPNAADYTKIQSRWVGMRPSTPNSLPLVGATRIPGLFLNIGHGMFGWTLSSICAERVTQAVAPQNDNNVLKKEAA